MEHYQIIKIAFYLVVSFFITYLYFCSFPWHSTLFGMELVLASKCFLILWYYDVVVVFAPFFEWITCPAEELLGLAKLICVNQILLDLLKQIPDFIVCLIYALFGRWSKQQMLVSYGLYFESRRQTFRFILWFETSFPTLMLEMRSADMARHDL